MFDSGLQKLHDAFMLFCDALESIKAEKTCYFFLGPATILLVDAGGWMIAMALAHWVTAFYYLGFRLVGFRPDLEFISYPPEAERG